MSWGELGTQRSMIVDLSIEDHMDAIVLVGDWLGTTFDVYHAQATHSKGYALAHVVTFFVWPAMRNRSAHRAEFVLRLRGGPVPACVPGDTTH
jgi:hypothetical protein